MIGALGLLLLQEYRFQFNSKLQYAFILFNAAVSLLVYWFASKAIMSSGAVDFNEQWMAGSYFEFLLTGELVLLFPLALVGSMARAVRFAWNEGLLEDFFLCPRGPFAPLVRLGAAMLLPAVLHMILVPLMAWLFCGYGFPPAAVFAILFSVTVTLPVFAAVGITAAAILLRFARGEGFLNQFSYAAGILAGSYFPLSVLPVQIYEFLRLASPFALLLGHCRSLSIGMPGEWEAVAALAAAGVILLPVSIWYFESTCGAVRKGRWPLLSHH